MPPLAERRSLASLLHDFDHHQSQLAVVTPNGIRQTPTTYRQLASLARRTAAEWERRGIEKGDRVLLWGENSAEWIAAFFGCVMRGVLPVPLDSAGSADFAKRVLEEVSPRLVLTDRAKLLDHPFDIPAIPFEELENAISPREGTILENLTPDDPLQIIFTSGTTGDPKGVVHTHGNVLASLTPIEREMQNYLKYERPFHPIRFLHTLPLSHVFGQFMGLWIPPLLAAEVHFQSRLVATELVEQIRLDRISVLASVPRVLDLLQNYLLQNEPDLATRIEAAQHWSVWQRWWHFRQVHRLFGLKFWAFICGGASLSPVGEQFWNALGFAVVQGYGMTETTALVSLNHPFHPAQGTIGQVLPGREVRLSEQGEVLVRGATISNATWQNGALQQQTEAWLPTGDLADFDPAGNLRFRGRMKDVIVTSSGLNIHPQDLEAALLNQPGVSAATVIETTGTAGPEPLAVLVVAPAADPATTIAGANRGLADFQQIRRWLLWPEPDLPRTSTGKILRREVARRIASGELDDNTQSQLAPGALNLDSLGRVQLQAHLEQQYGVSLPDQALQEVKTGQDLQSLLRQAEPKKQSPKREQHIYPRWTWRASQQAIRTVFLELIAMPLVRFLAKPRVRRQPRALPSPPLLIVCNHITTYDAAFVLFALPKHLRHRVAIAMSGEMLLDLRKGRNQGHWFLNLLAPAAYFLITLLFNVFPLPQRSGFRRSFRHAGRAMDRGYSVLVFPEGRRSDDATPQPFKSGAGLLWKESGAAALPVYISGLGELKSQSGNWFRSGTIEVSVGDILIADPQEPPDQLTDRLQAAVFGMRLKDGKS